MVNTEVCRLILKIEYVISYFFISMVKDNRWISATSAVPNFWYGRVDDWTPGGCSHVIMLVTSPCEPRPWQKETNIGFMNYWSGWQQGKQELRLEQCPKPPTYIQCTNTWRSPEPFKSMQACREFLILILHYFVILTFNACWKCITLCYTYLEIFDGFYMDDLYVCPLTLWLGVDDCCIVM